MLGEIGKGHKVALNTLNYGRFSLGAMCIGGARAAIADAATYAAQRRQFGQPIAAFGAIKHKLGEMIARTYAVESLVYRTAGLIDAALAGSSHDGASIAQAFEEYAVEASIAKVAGSEALDYVLDENVQIHGGNGFVKDYPAERYFRDARVNRIFEGTNEINRLLIPGMLVRRALKGELPLIPAATPAAGRGAVAVARQRELVDDQLLGGEMRAVAAFKKVALMVARHRDADLRREADGRAGGPQLRGRHPDRHLCRARAPCCALRAAPATRVAGRAARGGRACVRARCRRSASRPRADRAGGDGRGRHAAHAAGGAPPNPEGPPVNTVALRRTLADADGS